MTPSIKHIFTAILFALMITHDGYGWGRISISDQTVVERAELIVVGRIMPASIKLIDHPVKPGDGASYEHHAMLEIVETLKGSAKTTTVKIIIHFGLDPVTGRYHGQNFDHRRGMPDAAKNAIEIYDIGSGLDGRISGDVREPHIWLLSTKNPGYTTPDSTEFPGIWDPEDIQTVSKKEALKKWITAEPQATPIIRPLGTFLAILSAILAFCGAWLVIMNGVCVIVSLRNQRLGIDRHHSTTPFVGQILLLIAGLASSLIPRWILWTLALADISLWLNLGYIVSLPFRRRPQQPPSTPR